MTILEVFGGIMIAAPFIALFAWMAKEEGLAVAVLVLVAILILMLWISAGAILISGELNALFQ